MNVPKIVWRTCYELLAARVRSPDWAFMNYGYSTGAEAGRGPALQPHDEADRLAIQLYDHTLAAADLSGADVLEVGSGRGGGASYIARYRQPRTVTGLDFSERAVAFCVDHRRAPGLSFVAGDAQSMPFPDDSFDAVVNVESSHCYQSVDRFLAEVDRVLRPNGSLFFADLRTLDGLATLRRQWAGSSLTLQGMSDITDNVLAALRRDSDRKLELIRSFIPRAVRAPVRSFAGIRGTTNYNAFAAGRMRYVSAILTKSGPDLHAQL
jgi:SAM-dependent methyltransferase